MILCDADIVIDLDRGHPPAIAWAASITLPLAIAGIAKLEVLYARPNQQALNRSLHVLGDFRTIWPSEAWCEHAIDLLSRYGLSHGLQKYDALVAVTALSAGMPLHTFNVKHYRPVPGLATVQPYARP